PDGPGGRAQGAQAGFGARRRRGRPRARLTGPRHRAERSPVVGPTAAGFARARPQRMLTARETTRPSVTSETSDWMPMIVLAIGVRGIVSGGEQAVAFGSDT